MDLSGCVEGRKIRFRSDFVVTGIVNLLFGWMEGRYADVTHRVQLL